METVTSVGHMYTHHVRVAILIYKVLAGTG